MIFKECSLLKMVKMLFILKSNSEKLSFSDQSNDFTESSDLSLVSCGLFTETRLKSPYHISVILDNVDKIKLGSFIMPAGSNSLNFIVPFDMTYHIRGSLTQCKIEFVFEKLVPKENSVPKINFTYVNVEVNRVLSLDYATPRKRRRHGCRELC